VVAVVVLAAVAIAYFRSRKHFTRHAAFRPWSIAPVLAVVVAAVIFVGWSRYNEQRYLSEAMPAFPSTSAAALKDDGHEACDWLRGRHWGVQSEIPDRREHRFYKAISHGDYVAPEPASMRVSRRAGRSSSTRGTCADKAEARSHRTESSNGRLRSWPGTRCVPSSSGCIHPSPEVPGTSHPPVSPAIPTPAGRTARGRLTPRRAASPTAARGRTA
jgi:hypothetical protein